MSIQHNSWNITAYTAAIRCDNWLLRSTIELKAARIYLTRIVIDESLKFESEVELCDDSWREYTNKDCMTDASDSSCFLSFSLYEKIEEFYLQITNL